MDIGSNESTRNLLLAIERRLAPVLPRRAFLAAGRRMTPKQLDKLRTMLGAIEEGQWLRNAPAPIPNVADRFAVFSEALRRVHGTRPLYLEFGVYQGRTLRWWSEHLTMPTARFVGFDSFQGLPTSWQSVAPQGWFTPDAVPQFADPRVSLEAGWFEDTLRRWQPPDHDQLIINIDCDLYTSTQCVLKWLEPYLREGTLVYFDDLLDPEEELRALHEWLDQWGNSVVPAAMARWGQHLLVEWHAPTNQTAQRIDQAPQDMDQLLMPPRQVHPTGADGAAI